MITYHIETAVFYWLYKTYLFKMCSSHSLDECKNYFRAAVKEASYNCDGQITDSMRIILNNINTINSREELISYARNMVNKNYKKLQEAGVAN